MSNRLKKYGMMIIAAVLLVALAFAGAASAALTNVNDFSGLQTALTDGGEGAKLTGPITATAEITISGTKTLDLNGYTITISGAHRFATVGSGKSLTITDGKITEKPAYYFTYVENGPWTYDGNEKPASGTTVDLSDFDLTEAIAAAAGTYHVKVTGGVIYGGSENIGGGVSVTDGGTFKMSGGSITGCSASSDGGGVRLHSNTDAKCTFEMSGGSIAGCCGDLAGGVSLGSQSDFTMSGGSITGCSASGSQGNGGGVYLFIKEARFAMTGGSITGCSASGTYGGGGVYVSNGEFTMSGGSITGCSATNSLGRGGGVYIASSVSKFEMTGGSITGCSASGSYGGGGVYVSDGEFTMSSGSISDCSANNGGGVHVESGTFKVSGNAKVTGNTDKAPTPNANNVHLKGNNMLKLVGAFTGRIGISNPTSGQFGTVDPNSPTAIDETVFRFYLDTNAGTVGKIGDTRVIVWDTAATQVEVTTWAELKTVVEGWTDATNQRTITVLNSITSPNAKGTNDAGIVVKGNVKIIPAAGKQLTIDANESGRFFKTDTANAHLTLAGNTNSATLTLKNGTGSSGAWGNYAGGAIYVDANGKLTLSDGVTITKCSISKDIESQFMGGAVYVEGGEFAMDGGSISDCSVKSSNADTPCSGGAVYIKSGQFTMTGGSIEDCKAISPNSGTGGAVFINSYDTVAGTFEMSDDAVIEGCSAGGYGGGVYVGLNCSFTMTGGTISGCSAYNGGGVYVGKDGTFTMTDGSITKCSASSTGGGVEIAYYLDYQQTPCIGSFEVSGDAKVTGNTLSDKTTKSNVYLGSPSENLKLLAGSFTGTLGIENPSSGQFGIAETGASIASTGKIVSDANADFVGYIDGSNNLMFPYLVKDATELAAAFSSATDGATIILADSFTMSGEIEVTKTVTLDLNGKTLTAALGKTLFHVNESGKTFTLKDSGSGGKLMGNGMVNWAGGGVFVSEGTFAMTGGSITGCSATGNGGGVYVGKDGTFKVSGGATVTGNTKSGSPNNVYLYDGTKLQLTGAFTGTIGIANPLAVGQFGTIASSVTYSSGFVADKVGYTAYAEGTALKWKYTEYTITYNLDGGTNATTNPAKYTIVTPTITLADATKTGYTFDNWYSDAAMTVANKTIPAGSSGNKEFWAKFTPNKTTVTFDYIDLDDVQEDFTYGDDVTAEIPTVSERDGYAVNWKDSENIFITDPMYTDSTGKWVYEGADGGSLTFYADYETPTEVVEKAGASGTADIDKTTALAEGAAETVEHVVLETVSGLESGVTVTFVGASDIEEVGQLSGYTKVADISIFDVTVPATGVGADGATMRVKVTFADADAANKYKNNVRFVHYDTTKNQWETSPLVSSIESTVGNVVTYKVETDSFSPFGISIQTKNSSGSHQGGSRILPATDAPTVTPTQQPTTDATPLTPTVKPTQQQTQKSPAPLAGLVLGLGAAAVLLRLRR